MIDPEDPKVRWATFGQMCQDFLSGPIGSYMIERAKDAETKAISGLKNVDPEAPELVRKFQNDARVADMVIEWLADAIQQGDMALKQLKEDHDGD